MCNNPESLGADMQFALITRLQLDELEQTVKNWNSTNLLGALFLLLFKYKKHGFYI